MRAAALALLLVACGGKTEAQPAPPVEDVQPRYDYPRDGELRVDQLQAKATHNSYHLEPPNNKLIDWKYTHAPLDVQLDKLGVREVELDLHLEDGVFRVFHLKNFDDKTTCDLFSECLAVIKRWSDGHRGHHLLVVQMEAKGGAPGAFEGYFDELHREILSVWPEKRILTPAKLQGSYPTIKAALAARGWPKLGETRGMILFAMDERGDTQAAYTHDHKDLNGRLVFPDADPADAYAAFSVANDPTSDAKLIQQAIAAHMLVRTRADSDGTEAAANDTTRQKTALASGVNFVTTDFPVKVAGADYFLEIPGGTPSRCNPLTAPKDCSSRDIESPQQLLTP